MIISIDPRSDIPIYLQIVEQIRLLVVNGDIKPGGQLPTVRALALDLRINFNTVARAYRLLDEAGIISTQKGRGTFILDLPSPEMAGNLRAETMETITRKYIEQIHQLGFSDQEAISTIQYQAAGSSRRQDHTK